MKTIGQLLPWLNSYWSRLFSLKNGLQDVAIIYAQKNAEDFTLETVILIYVHCSSA